MIEAMVIKSSDPITAYQLHVRRTNDNAHLESANGFIWRPKSLGTEARPFVRDATGDLLLAIRDALNKEFPAIKAEDIYIEKRKGSEEVAVKELRTHIDKQQAIILNLLNCLIERT